MKNAPVTKIYLKGPTRSNVALVLLVMRVKAKQSNLWSIKKYIRAIGYISQRVTRG
jgi:hypothetical protein